jgi:integrase
MRHIRVIFNHAFSEGWIDRLPWGSKSFSLPKPKAIKKSGAGRPPKQATRDEILALLAAADPTWQALLLVGINSGSGNSDAALLKHSDIDADGWIEKPRNKTGEYRRFRLWPETRNAIEALPKHKDGLIIHSTTGATFIPAGRHNPISKGFADLATEAKVKRVNLTYYSLRHTYQTVADEALDFVATQIVMGHKRSSISDNYRGRISDQRLEAVTEHVRQWLFPPTVSKSVS